MVAISNLDNIRRKMDLAASSDNSGNRKLHRQIKDATQKWRNVSGSGSVKLTWWSLQQQQQQVRRQEGSDRERTTAATYISVYVNRK